MLPSRVRGEDFRVVARRLGRVKGVLYPRARLVIGHYVRADTSFRCTSDLIFARNIIRGTGSTVHENIPVVASARVKGTKVGGGHLTRCNDRILYFVSSRSITRVTGGGKAAETITDVSGTTTLKERTVFTIKGTPATLMQLCRLVGRKGVGPRLVVTIPMKFMGIIRSGRLVLDLRSAPSVITQKEGNKDGVTTYVYGTLLCRVWGEYGGALLRLIEGVR